MENTDREQLWQARLAEWQVGGKTQRAYAIENGEQERKMVSTGE
ncbi:hypothetical protein [Massilia genomosp. 1]|nr:hypothetical protein [Massilia genomosp. 1]